jgi:hypothetical protein
VSNGDYLGGISWNGRFDAEVRSGFANISALTRGSGVAALTFNVATSLLTPAEVMRVDYTGNVGIGTTSPSYTLHVNGSVAGTSAYNNLSDARLKKNVAPLQGGLALLGQLKPVRFDWRTKEERTVGKNLNLTSAHQVGFIAQDLFKVLPEAVSVADGDEAIMSVAESKIVPVLVSAVRELKTSNDNQALEIARLESQLLALQRKVANQTAQR